LSTFDQKRAAALTDQCSTNRFDRVAKSHLREQTFRPALI
jgi:hypothetical protein